MSRKCPRCGTEYSDDTARCPKCGRPATPLGDTPDDEPRRTIEDDPLEEAETRADRSPPDHRSDSDGVGFHQNAAELRPGDVVDDRYRIVELIGSGGMGAVYRAQQLQPVARTVALKVIKLGMDTRNVVARFDSERRALALMEHANIARVLDAGATASGRPYFVMEHVKGEPITDYCDRHNLSTAERLTLFRAVCDAIQHAHQKGIIHRDLKPTNVLVSIEGDTPTPKIIDFGIAKATGARLTEETLFTTTGQLVGTPEYMSPEQAEMSGLDVDTRTDIYSLGVMLYELLVGALPFEPERLYRAGLGEIRRIIRETDPPRPSTRFSQLGETRSSVARSRRTDAGGLARALRGDLDWITFKAMEKDRTRRYASASELAADIERHLRHEPVLAGPPSRVYRLKKYGRRHRTGVAAAVVVLLVLIAGIVGTTLGLVKAKRAQQAAAREAETAQQVSDFLVEMFEGSDPSQARGEQITAREILDRGARRIDSELTDQPQVRVRMMGTIGTVYVRLGLYREAEQLLKRGVEICEREFGADGIETAHALHLLASLRLDEKAYKEAERLGSRALEIIRRELGEEHEDTVDSLELLSWIHANRGEYEQAESHLQRCLEIRRVIYGSDSAETALSLQNLGSLELARGRFADGERLTRQALDIYLDVLGETHPRVAKAFNNMGLMCYRQGKLDAAEAALARSLRIREKLYGPTHPSLAGSLRNLAIIHGERGDLDQEEAFYRRALRIYEQSHGPEHLQVARILGNLGVVYLAREAYDEALAHQKRALEIREKVLGPDHPEVAHNLSNIGNTYLDIGRPESAEPLLRRSLVIREAALGPNHYSVASSLNNLGLACTELGKLDEAERTLKRALAIKEQAYGPEHAKVCVTLQALGELYRARDDSEQALSFFARALSTGEQTLAPRLLVDLLEAYATCLRETGDAARADELSARAEAISSELD